jgi:phosphoribosylformylglycinamidine synthase subunit PurQ / glutaminase
MKFGVVIFPGSNCDHDAYHVVSKVIGQPVDFIWHKEQEINGHDAIILPGGFSYGDYLRTGAIARFSPVMKAVKEFAHDGGIVLGICNGFQILCEAGLLPGALMRNAQLRFGCKDVYLRVERSDTAFTRGYNAGQVIRIPIAHGEGNYAADGETLAALEGDGRIVFRYVAPDGTLDPKWNVNGSTAAIAGIVNERRNVLGLMPHPENHVETALGSTDGRGLFAGIVDHLAQAA